MLKLENVDVAYGRGVQVLEGVSLAVGKGALVALLGANGAGKSTTLKGISNLLLAENGKVLRGKVELDGERIDGRDPADVVARGVAHVMEGRRLFAHLTVEENLRTGALQRRDRVAVKRDLERIFELFPQLTPRRHAQAGFLSGGEQQMVALGRALIARPRLLLLDEPSMGLAPKVSQQIFATIGELRKTEGLSIWLAEQNAAAALALVDYGYVLENGRVVLEGAGPDLRGNTDIRRFYLGLDEIADGDVETARALVEPI